MGWPMMPRPMKAMVVIACAPCLLVQSGVSQRCSAPRASGSQASWRRWSVVGLYSRPTQPSYPRAGEVAEQPVEVELAGAGLAATGAVGDLHVGRDVGVGGDRGGDVVAVVGEVEQVAEEADVGVPVLDAPPARPRRRRRPCATGRAWGRSPTRPGRWRRSRPPPLRPAELLAAEVVLLLGRDAVDPVAVERVERRDAELLADADRDVDVVAELRRRGRGWTARRSPARPGRRRRSSGRPAGRRRRATAETKPSTSASPGYGLVGPGPPELDRVEPGALAACGTLEQRVLGEEHRAVRQVAQTMVLSSCITFRIVEIVFRTVRE